MLIFRDKNMSLKTSLRASPKEVFARVQASENLRSLAGWLKFIEMREIAGDAVRRLLGAGSI